MKEIVLKYPADLNTANSDFVQFTHYPYRVNDALENSDGQGKLGSEVPPRQNRILMYMPNTTPGVQQVQNWQDQPFEGAKGQLIKQFLDAVGGAGSNRSAGNQTPIGLDGAGEIFNQMLLDQIAGAVSMDASTALQLGTGQVYSPNVEILYKMPKLRMFTFDFNFIPKSSADAKAADRIIREFKYWSAPGLDGIKFLTVPDLWKVTYFQGGTNPKKHSRMNPWKPAVIARVVTQDNPLSDLHSTISDPDGDVPVHTKMVLKFTETDIVTRKDHDKSAPQYVSGGKQKPYKGEGYKRGY